MIDYSKTLLYKKVTDLTEISDSSLDKLFNIAIQRELPKGEIILKQGQVRLYEETMQKVNRKDALSEVAKYFLPKLRYMLRKNRAISIQHSVKIDIF
jgi:hypothetical protein